MQKINIHCIGEDYWNRVVFKGDNGKFYKTIELYPRHGFDKLSKDEQLCLLRSLHTSNPEEDYEGEPCFPCWDPAKFNLIG